MLAKRRLLPFVQRLNPRYDAGWVHKDICRRLEKFSDDVAKGLSPRLMILMPPRHGKSELASRMFPAWHLGRHNDHEVIACAYNVSLAMSFSRKVKEAMDDPAYQSVFEARLNPDFRSNEEWGLLGKRGGYVAAGVGGGITGKGAHCIVGDTPVDTPGGCTTIQDLKVGDVVLGFNHDQCRIEPTTVQALRWLVKNDIYTIETASGKRVRVTGNHPVYVSGLGYLPAEQLIVGMPLLSLARGDSGGAVRALQNTNNHPTRVFAREAAQREQELELFPGVYYTAPSNPQELPDMFGGLHRPEQVLLANVQAYVPGAGHVQEARGAHRAGAKALPPVRGDVPPQIASDPVLWAGLRSGGPFREDARGREPELLGGQAPTLHELQTEDPPDDGQRSGGEVRRMWGDVEAVCAPQRRGQGERHPDQLGSGVPYMSFGPSQICEDPISSIELDRSKYEVVYDIQTSLSNFLIHTLVAHNCLIIDDPIKNAEEADSADVREKLWDWYGSTAYTRLAPGGGVLVIQCMTGDTPVRLPDGTEKRLDAIRAGDEVATFDDGRLGVSTVAAWKSSGYDYVFTITMTSGRVVRANGRHPFLVSTDEGLRWIRAKNLTMDHRIVAFQGSAGSGSARFAPQMGASYLRNAAGSAPLTTTRRSGLMGTAHPQSTQRPAETPTSNIAMGSRLKRTLSSWLSKAGSALSAATLKTTGRQGTGAGGSASITTTPPVQFGVYSAMTATLPLGTSIPNVPRSLLPRTSDFTTDSVQSVEPSGREEVFDVQVNRTENFIANGLVSHNTWWHDDDLAGRLQTAMSTDDEADQFELVKYPAIAEHDEYLDDDTDLIVYSEPPERGKLIRLKGEPLHPERYDLVKLNRIKKTIPTRFWAALYQQNPVPDDGAYFTKDMFRRAALPPLARSNVFIAFDFAISEKKANDYTVGVVGLQDEDDVLHFADMVRFKSGDGMFIVEAILNLCQKWYTPNLVLGFEDGQIFRAIESLLKKRMRERKFYPSTMLLKPITDKQARARPLQGRMQQGMVSFCARGDWVDGARTEMLRFPAGVHDDQVDAIAWAATMAIGREPPRKLKSQEPESWRKKLASLGGSGASYMTA